MRYIGEFRDYDNALWRCVITTSAQGEDEDEDVTMGGTPVIINRDSDDKTATFMSAQATIEVLSDTNFKFLHLYTDKDRDTTIHIYRDGILYWCGFLDPEQYEEPFRRETNYIVTLTFSDIGALDRVRCPIKAGTLLTVKEIAESCMCPDGKNKIPVEWHTSTTTSKYELVPTQLGDYEFNAIKVVNTPAEGAIHMMTDNYFDEGKRMSCKEVLSSLLQPLALRLEQRQGKWHVYDTHYMATSAPAIAPVPRGGNATLTIDKIYNNVKMEVSPYDTRYLLKKDNIKKPKSGVLEHTYTRNVISGNLAFGGDKEVVDSYKMSVWRAQNNNTVTSWGSSYLKFFELSPVNFGTFARGIIFISKSVKVECTPTERVRASMDDRKKAIEWKIEDVVPTENENWMQLTRKKWNLATTYKEYISCDDGAIITKKIKLPIIEDQTRKTKKIDLSIDFLASNFPDIVQDYSPEWIGKSINARQAKKLYMAISVSVTDDSGKIMYTLRTSADTRQSNYNEEYYSRKDIFEKRSVGLYWGKGTTRSLIDIPVDVENSWKTSKMSLPVPQSGGYLEISLYPSLCATEFVSQMDWKTKLEEDKEDKNAKDLKSKFSTFFEWPNFLQHFYIKDITMELVSRFDETDEAYNIEMSATINNNAKDDCDMGEITMSSNNDIAPTALARCRDAKGNVLPRNMERGDMRGSVEELLIGTIYSNYAKASEVIRCIIQSPKGLTAVTLRDKRYICVREEEDIRRMKSEIDLAEVRKDTYIPELHVNEEEDDE